MTIGAGKHVVICGAGLAGALQACYLGKLGYRVTLYERRGDPRQAGYMGGRSINLALSARGLWGLEGIGLKDEILTHAIPMRGRIMHKAEQKPRLIFQPYSKNPADAINSISRGGLNLALLNAAAKLDNVTLVFNQRCTDVDVERCTATFVDDSGGVRGNTTSPPADLIIGADGAFSAVRTALQKTDRFDYDQRFLGHGYKELHIPPAASGDFALNPNALHIWPRGSAMMIALPNPDQSFTCTLFWPFEGEHSFANLNSPAQVEDFFHRQYPDAVPLMPTLAQDFMANPVGSLVTVRCWPWSRYSARGTVVLVGDAAHAIVPFYGQGMNAAFEDVRVLAETLEAKGGDIRAAVDEYQRIRKPNADAIADMALENFVEMRDKVGSRAFLWKKRFEHAVEWLMPWWFRSRYELVSFSTVPYTRARAAGLRYDKLLAGLSLFVALAAGVTAWALGWGLIWLLLAGFYAGIVATMFPPPVHTPDPIYDRKPPGTDRDKAAPR
jgi:kynurenine 3-monooxygenase